MAGQRQAIHVDEDRGVYQFTLGAERQPYRELVRQSQFVRVDAKLTGWAPWQWAVSTDTGTYFVTGQTEPKEYGADPAEATKV